MRNTGIRSYYVPGSGSITCCIRESVGVYPQYRRRRLVKSEHDSSSRTVWPFDVAQVSFDVTVSSVRVLLLNLQCFALHPVSSWFKISYLTSEDRRHFSSDLDLYDLISVANIYFDSLVPVPGTGLFGTLLLTNNHQNMPSWVLW